MSPTATRVLGEARVRLAWRSWATVRLLCVAAVPLLAAWWDAPAPGWTVAALAVWVVASSWPRSVLVCTIADVGVASALVFTTGDVVTPYVLYVVAAVAAAGVVHGGVAGTAAGGVVSLARVLAMAFQGTLDDQPAELILTSLALLPLTGLAAGMTVETVRRSRSGRGLLAEANQLLVELQRVAGAIPGGLDIVTVAGAALEEIRSVCRPSYVVVFADDAGILRAAAPTEERSTVAGLSRGRFEERVGGHQHRLCTSAEVGELVPELAQHGHAHWLLVPLRSRGAIVGAFAVAFDAVSDARNARRNLAGIAADTALALDNARLLGATTARAASAARRRIAHDLHDSVAQSLAHLKMELELLTLGSPDDVELREEARRLARVAGRALDDVRSTITGLRGGVTDDGLVPALRRHVEDLSGHGAPRLVFDAVGDHEVDPTLAPDLLCVAQEAISNAVRHADARNVSVTLEVDDETIELVVEDDGRGLPDTLQVGHGSGGVGLRAMRERAADIGGEVTIRPRLGGGTVVTLRCEMRGRRPRRRAVRAGHIGRRVPR